MYKYLFGPVPSRRLGKSLGIDIVKPKTCNMNCVFCECGATDKFSEKRRSYIDIEIMKEEVSHALENVNFDCITLSGSGEPTLNKDLGKIVASLKKTTSKKVVLITNSSLLSDKNVRKEIKDIDIVIPTLNTVFNSTFKLINRADEKLNIEDIKEGLKLLGKEFRGSILLETFIIEGLNDTKKELDALSEFLKTIKYTKLQLNSLDRVGAESWVKPTAKKRLEEIRKYLENNGVRSVEIIGKFETEEKIKKDEELIKNMKLKRVYSEKELKSIFNN